MTSLASTRRRGSPLAVLGILLGVWIMGRAVLWESPFPIDALDLNPAELLVAGEARGHEIEPDMAGIESGTSTAALDRTVQSATALPFLPLRSVARPDPQLREWPTGKTPLIAAGHQFLMAAAFRLDFAIDGSYGTAAQAASGASLASPVAPPMRGSLPDTDRWWLDAFAFYREGSSGLSTSQGRVPVYGASQAAASLQYRLSPGSRHEPLAYLRGYRALVSGGETEVAVGISARPFGAVPVRVAAEWRVIEDSFGTDVRPAAYAVTELPVVQLPADFRIEAYAGAGYVAGNADTPFIDGHVALTREVAGLDGPSSDPIRLTLGGGAWGGAQENASRLDVGPTLRIDLTVGEVPARLSVDWRERVAGDAAPNSGFAATLSTRF